MGLDTLNPLPYIVGMNSKELTSLIKCFKECGNSPKMRVYAVRGLIAELHSEFTSEQVETLLKEVIKPWELEAAEHTQRGSDFGKKKSQARAQKTYQHPGYCETLKDCQCSTCHQTLSGKGFVFHSEDGQWFYYHPLEECFPSEHKSIMKNNPKWLKAMRPIHSEPQEFKPYSEN